MNNNDLQKQIDELKKEIESLKYKRIYQQDVTPDAIKQRAMGEGNRFIRSGLSANLPTTGESVKSNSSPIYFETDTNKLKVYNSTGTPGWKSTTLS